MSTFSSLKSILKTPLLKNSSPASSNGRSHLVGALTSPSGLADLPNLLTNSPPSPFESGSGSEGAELTGTEPVPINLAANTVPVSGFESTHRTGTIPVSADLLELFHRIEREVEELRVNSERGAGRLSNSHREVLSRLDREIQALKEHFDRETDRLKGLIVAKIEAREEQIEGLKDELVRGKGFLSILEGEMQGLKEELVREKERADQAEREVETLKDALQVVNQRVNCIDAKVKMVLEKQVNQEKKDKRMLISICAGVGAGLCMGFFSAMLLFSKKA